MKKSLLGIIAALFVLALLLPVGAHATDNVYAILYTDGTLVFQNGNTPESGRTATNTYAVDLSAAYTLNPDTWTPDTPWYDERTSVRVVSFADRVNPVSTAYWFNDCTNLERVENIQNLDTANVTDMNHMFCGCLWLTELDVSHFNTANVTDMSYMFSDCWRLPELDVSRFNTANVTNMEYTFAYCKALTELDVSHFNTANVTTMYGMFYDCEKLTELDVSHFDTAKVRHMVTMFGYCSGLTALDLSHFDTANVIGMDAMFGHCDGLTVLDLSSFDTVKASTMTYMFEGSPNLTTIYVSDRFTTASVGGSNDMFADCTSLVGGNGTRFSESHTDKEYARIDTASAPGYFTYKTAPVSYAITAAAPGTNGQLSVTLTNSGAATFAAAYFDTNGKFVSADVQGVSANAGTVTSSVPANAKTARVMLFDNDCRPLCVPFEATIS